MSTATLFMLAIGLSMDTFAVSISSGARSRTRLLQNALMIAMVFALVQGLMPLLGWLAGNGLRGITDKLNDWIVVALLTVLGCKMIYESISDERSGEEKKKFMGLTFRLLLTLALATSLDALAVGIGFSLIKASIFGAVWIIGLVTFLFSISGVVIGYKFGRIFGKKFELIGGLILILIGAKVLFIHFFPTMGQGLL